MIPHLQLFLLAMLLAGSAAISACETALFALSRQELRVFAASGNRFKRLAVHLMQQPRLVLTTVLIINTTVNIGFFVVSFFLFEQLSVNHPLVAWLGGVVVTPFVLILGGEVLPKALALAHGPSIAPFAGPVIEICSLLLSPLRWILERGVVAPLTRIILPGPGKEPHVTREELRALVEMSARQGVINPRENEMLQQIVTLPVTSVRAVMVPRVDVAAVSLQAERATVARRIHESGKKKIPVFGRDLDDIRGLIHAVDLYCRQNRPLHTLIKPVHFVPEQANLLHLVQHFRRTGTQLAIVVDEYGGTAGLVTLEDVLEHIVGDIAGANEGPPEPPVEVLDEKTYRLSGDISVHALVDFFGLGPRAEQVETLGGFMLAQMGRLPKPGDVVRTANLKLTVERVAARRVQSVRVELVDATAESTAAEAVK